MAAVVAAAMDLASGRAAVEEAAAEAVAVVRLAAWEATAVYTVVGVAAVAQTRVAPEGRMAKVVAVVAVVAGYMAQPPGKPRRPPSPARNNRPGNSDTACPQRTRKLHTCQTPPAAASTSQRIGT